MNNKKEIITRTDKVKLKIGYEHVIARGCRYEENAWGEWQFPRPYNIHGRLVCSVDVSNDDIVSFGEPKRWYESKDTGNTWHEIFPKSEAEFGLLLPNGDRICFPMESAVSIKEYKMPDWKMLTPAYDFNKKAIEGTLPQPDGMTYWLDGTVIKAYNADRLPPSLAKKEWHMERIPNGESVPVREQVKVDWPYLTRVVFTNTMDNVLKPIFPRGNPKIGPDGAIWITALSGEGHINPKNGKYSPYYSAELFRSEDNGHTFKQHAHMEYEADGNEYPYRSGGFSDSDIEFMPDGSIVWFLRTAWAMFTGREWDPMYMSRSTDNGVTWSKPVKFADTGILPRLCRLECGTVLLCYARPGTFVCACNDGKGLEWTNPVTVMTGDDRSGLHNLKIENPTFHEWGGSCENPEIIPIDEKTAMLFYTDFYYPDEKGVKRKTVLCRKITVLEE